MSGWLVRPRRAGGVRRVADDTDRVHRFCMRFGNPIDILIGQDVDQGRTGRASLRILVSTSRSGNSTSAFLAGAMHGRSRQQLRL